MTETAIPSTIYVPCPAISFKNRAAVKCLSCKHFEGIVDVMPGAPAGHPFDQRFRIGCAHIVARRVITLEMEENAGTQ